MANYVVFRHGSNSVNQPMTSRMLIGVIEAKSRKALKASPEYKDLVSNCYANQYLEVKTISQLNSKEWVELKEFESNAQ